MTRKDYQRIADAISEARANSVEMAELIGIDRVIDQLERELKADNHNYNHERFQEACFSRDQFSRALN